MKRIFSSICAVTLLSALAVPFSASAVNKSAVITTEIQPTYLITIPADLNVVQNQEQTKFGAVELEQAQIEPNKCIRVSLVSDGLLKHEQDATKTLAYTVNQSDDGTVFTSATYQTSGEKTDLTIGIKKDDWKSAFAGVYHNTVTFRIEYADLS